MAAVTSDQNAGWRITFIPQPRGEPVTHDVKAAYPTTDDVPPGWTLLKGIRRRSSTWSATRSDRPRLVRADHRVELAGRAAPQPVIAGDIPKKREPLPKFLDDRDAARLMAAARASADPRDRLVVELLARTGMRAGELADLGADAVVQIGAGHWLRIPLGKLRNDRCKLRNDRCVPLQPDLVGLLAAWTADCLEHIRAHKRLVADHRGPLDRHVVGGSCAASAVPQTFPACTRTGCGTPWPPRPPTAACGWRPSPPWSATRKWR